MGTIITDQDTIVQKGAVLPFKRLGMIENTITLGGVTDAADEAVQVFTMKDDVLVLAAGMEIITPTTETIDASLGTGGGGGSCTQLVGESDVSDVAGTHYEGGQGLANVNVAADDTIDIEVSGDAGAAGVVRIWAIIADIENADGS